MKIISKSNLTLLEFKSTIDKTRNHKCAFFDRDGVLIKDTEYINEIKDVIFINEAFQVIKTLKQMGYLIGIVTNQSGIGRGYFSQDRFIDTQNFISDRFQKENAGIDFVIACPYHKDALPPYNHESDYRKPNPGMILEICKHLKVDKKKSFMVGDNYTDVQCSLNAELGKSFLFYNKEIHKEAKKLVYNKSKINTYKEIKSLHGIIDELG